MMNQTIFALATAPGQAGVAVVRISGPQCAAVIEGMVRRPLVPRTASLASLRDPESDSLLDQALCLFFSAPASFTGEDVLELHLHGGRAVVDGVLAALSGFEGVRPAEPGEFTRRAFDNDKLDLAEVEGLADLIAAETEAQREQALRQMDGELSRLVEGWKDRLVRALAHLEADIDFPDEELEEGISDQARETLTELSREMLDHLNDGHRGERLRDGFNLAIVGPPNAGKSSLLNLLARRDVAIVSDVAGTTRDVIETHLNIAGYPVTLADTAGLRDLAGREGDGIELEGMKRARARADSSDLKVAVFDVSSWTPDAGSLNAFLDQETLELVSDSAALIVLNKLDASSHAKKLKEAVEAFSERREGDRIFVLSVSNGQGVDGFLERLEGWVTEKMGVSSGGAALTRERHRVALREAQGSLSRALAAGELPELVAEDVRLAVRSLGRITGRVDVDDLLDVIFRDFCLGK